MVAPNPAIDRVLDVDALSPGDVHRPMAVLALPGSKPFNVARTARLLGARVTVVAILGGYAGRWVLDAAAAEGIDVRPIQTDHETRVCTSILDVSTGQLTEFYEAGSPVSGSHTRAFEAAIRAELAVGDVRAVVCSGSLPQGASTDLYARVIRSARRSGTRAFVDATGPELMEAVAERPAAVKVNAREASASTGVRIESLDDAVEAATALRGKGARVVIVTLGIDGAVGTDRAEAAIVVEPPQEVGRYSVGSGDAFLAGYLHGFDVGGLESGLRWAAASGQSNARRPGAGRIDPDEVMRQQASIRTRAVAARPQR